MNGTQLENFSLTIKIWSNFETFCNFKFRNFTTTNKKPALLAFFKLNVTIKQKYLHLFCKIKNFKTKKIQWNVGKYIKLNGNFS